MATKGIDISGFIPNYYEVGPTSIEPAQVIRIPSLYPNKDKLILNIDVTSDPTEQHLVSTVSPLAQRTVQIPIKSLNLASDEYYFAVKGKMRPAIVLAGGFVRWETSPTEQLFVCVPLYGVDKPRISQRFVIEVQALKYPGMFYLPPSPEFRLEESVARFSLIQVAHGSESKLHRSGSDPVMLSDEFFGWMRSHLIEYLGAELPNERKKDLAALSELVIGEAKAQGVY